MSVPHQNGARHECEFATDANSNLLRRLFFFFFFDWDMRAEGQIHIESILMHPSIHFPNLSLLAITALNIDYINIDHIKLIC